MKLRIYAQNALDGLSRIDSVDEYVDAILAIQPDLAVFTEAYKEGNEHNLRKFIEDIGKDYNVIFGPYDEYDNRKDAHGILLAVKSDLLLPTEPPKLVRIGGRNIVECSVGSPGNSSNRVRIFGAHLNDRSESKRQAELDDLLTLVNTEEIPTIVAGDLNTLHKRHATGSIFIKARIIHFLVRLKLMPIRDPGSKPEVNDLARKGSIYYRLHEMASGKTIARLESNGFSDADKEFRLTFPANKPFAQLDHILISPQLNVEKFTVLAQGSSDHLGIVADIITN